MDTTVFLRSVVEELTARRVAAVMVSDCESLVGAVHSLNPRCAEKRLLREVRSIHEALYPLHRDMECDRTRAEIDDLVWTSSRYQLADELTKPSSQPMVLKALEQRAVRFPMDA